MITFDQARKLIEVHGGVRKRTMLLAADLLKSIQEDYADESIRCCMVETGTWRGNAGDGYSTWLLGAVAQSLRKELYSIDDCLGHVRMAEEHIKEHPESSVRVVFEDSIQYLSRLYLPIGFLYLDSFDYNYLDPLPAQLHNFGECCAAIGKMSIPGIILCDDCNFPGGGKPFLTVPWLEKRGWKVIAKEEQVLLANWDFKT